MGVQSTTGHAAVASHVSHYVLLCCFIELFQRRGQQVRVCHITHVGSQHSHLPMPGLRHVFCISSVPVNAPTTVACQLHALVYTNLSYHKIMR